MLEYILKKLDRLYSYHWTAIFNTPPINSKIYKVPDFSEV